MKWENSFFAFSYIFDSPFSPFYFVAVRSATLNNLCVAHWKRRQRQRRRICNKNNNNRVWMRARCDANEFRSQIRIKKNLSVLFICYMDVDGLPLLFLNTESKWIRLIQRVDGDVYRWCESVVRRTLRQKFIPNAYDTSSCWKEPIL